MKSKKVHSISLLVLLGGLGLMSLAPYGSCACNQPLTPASGPLATPTPDPILIGNNPDGNFYFYKDQGTGEFSYSGYPITTGVAPSSTAAKAGPLGLQVFMPPLSDGWSGWQIDASDPIEGAIVLDVTSVRFTKALKFSFYAVDNSARSIKVGLMLQDLFHYEVPINTQVTAITTWYQVSLPLNANFNTNFLKYNPATMANDSHPVYWDKIASVYIDCNNVGPAKNFYIDEIGIY